MFLVLWCRMIVDDFLLLSRIVVLLFRLWNRFWMLFGVQLLFWKMYILFFCFVQVSVVCVVLGLLLWSWLVLLGDNSLILVMVMNCVFLLSKFLIIGVVRLQFCLFLGCKIYGVLLIGRIIVVSEFYNLFFLERFCFLVQVMVLVIVWLVCFCLWVLFMQVFSGELQLVDCQLFFFCL